MVGPSGLWPCPLFRGCLQTLWASTTGAFLAIFLAVVQRILTLDEAVTAWMGGMKAMLLAMVILVLSWSLGNVTGELYAKDFLAHQLSDTIPPQWMPILVFFYMGFEHSIVNMYLFPSGLMLGGKFTFMDYMLWNEIPTVLGNLVGGLTFVGATLYSTHYKQAPKRLA